MRTFLATLMLTTAAGLGFMPMEKPRPEAGKSAPQVSWILPAAVAPPVALPVIVDQVPKPAEQPKFPRGRVKPESVASLRTAANKRNDDIIGRLPKVAAASFDCVALGWVCQVIDQGQCGSCWDFSGTEMCSSAFIKAGAAPGGASFLLSTQYTMDCYRTGGCNGDDNTTVLIHAKAVGLPSEADYGTYRARSGNCGYKSSMPLYTISNWGYCTLGDSQAVAKTDDIKKAMVAYGAIGCAIDASALDSYNGGVISGNGNNIDHDVLIVGWDDAKGRAGAWKVQNSWGKGWGGIGGYFWIEYGSYSVGTEAVWCTVVAPAPPPPPVPPPPVPPPPGPTPPPPGPVPPNTTSMTMTGPLVVGGSFAGEVLPTGTNAAIQQLAGIAQPTPVGPVLPLEKRMDRVEGNVAEILKILRMPSVPDNGKMEQWKTGIEQQQRDILNLMLDLRKQLEPSKKGP